MPSNKTSFTIESVENGYILTCNSDDTIYVFNSFKDLIDFIASELKQNYPMDYINA